ncbi:MAG: hypothetical protein LM517_12495 [Nitrosomonas sp.]|nr:hypothetical protein [Nitrosomonas sp.]
MDDFFKISSLSLIAVLILSACMTAPSRQELLKQKVIYSHSSDKNYLVIAECLKSEDGFPLPKRQSQNWRDINTFFIYHETAQIDGYPQLHDEATKTYYVTEIHDPKSLKNAGSITFGNGNWIMTIKDTGNSQGAQSLIEIRSDQNLLSDYPPKSYSPDLRDTLAHRLYKVEEIDRCF